MDLLFGYTTALINQDLLISSANQIGAASVAVSDLFSTENEFHALTAGVLAQRRFGCLTLEMLGKISFGNMHQTAALRGDSTTEPGAGLLVRSNNSGEFSDDVFAVAPELGINLIYSPSPCLDLTVGYSFLYWSSVAQSVDLIDPLLRVNANDAPIAGEPPHPGFEFRNSDFWVHGINAGLRVSF
jgi:hypothetical protein